MHRRYQIDPARRVTSCWRPPTHLLAVLLVAPLEAGDEKPPHDMARKGAVLSYHALISGGGCAAVQKGEHARYAPLNMGGAVRLAPPHKKGGGGQLLVDTRHQEKTRVYAQKESGRPRPKATPVFCASTRVSRAPDTDIVSFSARGAVRAWKHALKRFEKYHSLGRCAAGYGIRQSAGSRYKRLCREISQKTRERSPPDSSLRGSLLCLRGKTPKPGTKCLARPQPWEKNSAR